MSGMTVPACAGVIHDIGYQRYDGPPAGPRVTPSARCTCTASAAVFGLGRSGQGEDLPVVVVGVVTPGRRVIDVAIQSQTGRAVTIRYAELPRGTMAAADRLSLAAQSRPSWSPGTCAAECCRSTSPARWRRSDYALAKLAALVTALCLLLAGPCSLIFVGGAVHRSTAWPRVWRRARPTSCRPASARGHLRGRASAASALLIASLRRGAGRSRPARSWRVFLRRPRPRSFGDRREPSAGTAVALGRPGQPVHPGRRRRRLALRRGAARRRRLGGPPGPLAVARHCCGAGRPAVDVLC